MCATHRSHPFCTFDIATMQRSESAVLESMLQSVKGMVAENDSGTNSVDIGDDSLLQCSLNHNSLHSSDRSSSSGWGDMHLSESTRRDPYDRHEVAYGKPGLEDPSRHNMDDFDENYEDEEFEEFVAGEDEASQRQNSPAEEAYAQFNRADWWAGPSSCARIGASKEHTQVPPELSPGKIYGDGRLLGLEPFSRFDGSSRGKEKK